MEHIETVIRRAEATGAHTGKIAEMLWFIRGNQIIEGVHPLQGGLFRRKYRQDRRPGLPIESPWIFYPRYLSEIATRSVRHLALAWKIYRIHRRVKSDPGKERYSDLALMAADDDALTIPGHAHPIEPKTIPAE